MVIRIQKIFFSISILFCLSGYGQTNQTQKTDSLIKKLRKEFQAINSDTTLKTILLEGDEFMEQATDGGGELSGYFKNKSLVKIVEQVGISHGNRTREFYFKDNKLFFVFSKFESFMQTNNGLDLSKVKTSFEGRYYFSNEKLVMKKTTGENSLGAEPLNGKELVDLAKENSKLLSKKKP